MRSPSRTWVGHPTQPNVLRAELGFLEEKIPLWPARQPLPISSPQSSGCPVGPQKHETVAPTGSISLWLFLSILLAPLSGRTLTHKASGDAPVTWSYSPSSRANGSSFQLKAHCAVSGPLRTVPVLCTFTESQMLS